MSEITKVYKKIFFAVLFFVIYILAGMVDQTYFYPDKYPFSDWYIFSFVNTKGKAFELKKRLPDGTFVYVKPLKASFGGELSRAAKLIRRNNRVGAESIVKEITDDEHIRGHLTLVEVEFERLEYYKTGKWEREKEVATFIIE